MRSVLSAAIDTAAADILDRGIQCPPSGPTSATFPSDISKCPVGGPKGETVQAMARRLVEQQFAANGYSTRPVISPPILLNPVTRRLAITATAAYPCSLSRVLVGNCSIGINETVGGAGLPTPSRQRGLTLIAPPTSDLWLGERSSPALPTQLSVSNGTAPFSFSVGPRLPHGLSLNQVTGQINGLPRDEDCIAPCSPELRSIAVSVTDREDPAGQRPAAAALSYRIVHKLKLKIEQIPASQVAFSTQTTGGIAPFRYSCSNPPSGMACDPHTGEIRGAALPGASGTITVRVVDGRGKTADAVAVYRSPSTAPSPSALANGARLNSGKNLTN